MTKVFIAHITTESCDHYIDVYTNEPTREEVIKNLMDHEGYAYDDPYYGFVWFDESTRVQIEETTIIENSRIEEFIQPRSSEGNSTEITTLK